MINFFKKKAKGKKVTLKLSGMHCASCALNIDGALEDCDCVHSASTSYAKSEVTIDFDEKKISIKELQKIIADQGYGAE